MLLEALVTIYLASWPHGRGKHQVRRGARPQHWLLHRPGRRPPSRRPAGASCGLQHPSTRGRLRSTHTHAVREKLFCRFVLFVFFPNPLAVNTEKRATCCIFYYVLFFFFFLFWMEENIQLKFLYEENNCLWQPVYQSVWRYLFSAILYSWKKTSLVLCLETAGIYTHLDS